MTAPAILYLSISLLLCRRAQEGLVVLGPVPPEQIELRAQPRVVHQVGRAGPVVAHEHERGGHHRHDRAGCPLGGSCEV